MIEEMSASARQRRPVDQALVHDCCRLLADSRDGFGLFRFLEACRKDGVSALMEQGREKE